jgi:hypothetical protein
MAAVPDGLIRVPVHQVGATDMLVLPPRQPLRHSTCLGEQGSGTNRLPPERAVVIRDVASALPCYSGVWVAARWYSLPGHKALASSCTLATMVPAGSPHRLSERWKCTHPRHQQGPALAGPRRSMRLIA